MADTLRPDALPANRLADAIREKQQEIRSRYTVSLRGVREFTDSPPLLSDLGVDLLQTLLELLREGGMDVAQASIPYVDAVDREDYTLSHFHAEVRALKAATLEVLVGTHANLCLEPAHRALDGLFGNCLDKTNLWGELGFEQSQIGYCCVDQHGNIIRANRALSDLLGRNDIAGTAVSLLFRDHERSFMETILSGPGNLKTLIRRTKLHAGAKDVPVIVEVGPLAVPGRPDHSHFSFIDITRVVEAERRTLDTAPWPMLRVDADFSIDYANEDALRLFGLPRDKVEGRFLSDLLTNADDRRTITEQRHMRLSGQVGDYELCYERPEDQRVIPIHVHGWPEYDTMGQVSGATGFLTDRTFEKAHSKITDTLTHLSADVLVAYEELLVTLKDAVGADMGTIGVYATGMTYWRAMARVPSEGAADTKRWWRLSPNFAEWVCVTTPVEKIVADFPAWVENDPLLRIDPVVSAMVRAGYRSLLIYPVRTGASAVTATISLWKKQANYFSNDDFQLIGRLRAEKVVGAGLYYLERKKQEFLLGIINQLSASDEVTLEAEARAAKVIANCLRRFYDWQHTSIFKVTPTSFRLLAQASGTDGFNLPGGYEQPIDIGVLGRTYKQRQPSLHGNTSQLEEYLGQPGRHEKMCSELCFPLIMGDDVVWLINLEDPLYDAFCEVDVVNLNEVVTAVRPFLGLLFTKLTLDEVVRVASDGIIVADAQGGIQSLNPSAQRMLQVSSQAGSERRLQEFISTSDSSYDLFQRGAPLLDTLPLRTMELTDALGGRLKVRLTASRLPDGSGRFVAFIQDQRQVYRLEEFEGMAGALREIAMQTRLPLTLARTGMEALTGSALPEVAESARTAIRQLDKADETFERIVLYGEPAERLSPFFQQLSLNRLIQDLCSDFSPAERKAIQVIGLDQLPPISGDAYQLGFAFRSLLNYLLRIRPPEGRVIVSGGVEDLFVSVTCQGNGHHVPSGPGDEADPALRARAEVGLGREVLTRFVVRTHGGKFVGPDPDGQGRILFCVRLPIGAKGRPAEGVGHSEERGSSEEQSR